MSYKKKNSLDKPGKMVTLNEHIGDSKKNMEPIMDERPGPQNEDLAVTDFNLDDEFFEKVKQYNSKIKKLDPQFSNLEIMNSRLLCRVFLKEAEKDENGLFIKPMITQRVKTPSGVGDLYSFVSPFPFSRKLIVVSSGDERYKAGDVISVRFDTLEARQMGAGDNLNISPARYFSHPDGPVFSPTDPLDSYYGYMLVDPFEIDCKIIK